MSLTREELQDMSDDELKALLKSKKNDVAKFDVMQLGLKVTLNSAYGMIGNEFSRYFDTRIAEGITVSGQLSIRWIERKLDIALNKMCGTEGLNFAVAGDTDSIYLSLNPLVEKHFPDLPKAKIVELLDRVCEEKLQPVIDSAYAELADYMNAFEQKMFMAREVISDRGIWRAKKNYALNVWNSEGVAYDEPKLKIMGMESTRSSTPEFCRNAISDTIKLIMTAEESDVQKFIAKFKDEFMSFSIEDMSKNTGVKDIDKWKVPDGADFISGTPWHVKASMVYNRMIDDLDLGHKYQHIRNGDKVKIVYLHKANPTRGKAIAYPDILPPEFKLDRFISKRTQYEKNYYQPIKSLMDIVGWQMERKATLW